MSNNKKINRSIEFRNGSYSSVVTIIALALVIIINLIVNTLPASVMTFDTNGIDYYSISRETKSTVKALNNDINLYLLSDSSGSYEEYSETICKAFSDASNKVNLKKIDVAINPTFAAKYKANTASANSVIIENSVNGKYIVKDYNELVYNKPQYDEAGNVYTIYYYDGEGQILSGINYVTNNSEIKIYEITGHGEAPIKDYLGEAFEKNNYILDENKINLLNSSIIPEDCDVLFVNGPVTDYTLDEAEILKNYISTGKNVIFMYNRQSTDEMTNFESILSYVGIKVEYGLIVENDPDYYYAASQYAQYTLIPSINNINPITNSISKSIIMTMAASPISKVETNDCIVSYDDLLKTSSNYQILYIDDNYTVDYTTPTSLATFVNASFTASASESNILVIGNSKYLEKLSNDNSILNNNIKLITNAIAYMTGEEITVSLEPKTLEERFNVVTEKQVNLFTLIYLGMIPVTVLLIGFCVWYIRRSK